MTRSEVLEFLTSVTAAIVTGTLRDLPSHVRIGEEHGLGRESNVNCDILVPVRRAELTEPIGRLDQVAEQRLDDALRFALGL